MQGTRDRVLEHILEHRGARVDELAEALRITPAAVRRHVDHLRGDGLVEARSVKQATGRPFHAYYATAEAAGHIPAPYADLFARMLRSLGEQHVDEAVATGVAVSLADRHRSEVPGQVQGETRVQRVTESLRSEGILESWHAEDDGYHLLNSTCPYPQAAELSRLPCEADRQAIGLLLGSDVEQIERIVDGSSVCEYVLRANLSEKDDEGRAQNAAPSSPETHERDA